MTRLLALSLGALLFATAGCQGPGRSEDGTSGSGRGLRDVPAGEDRRAADEGRHGEGHPESQRLDCGQPVSPGAGSEGHEQADPDRLGSGEPSGGATRDEVRQQHGGRHADEPREGGGGGAR
jgi:hypothetical protein